MSKDKIIYPPPPNVLTDHTIEIPNNDNNSKKEEGFENCVPVGGNCLACCCECMGLCLEITFSCVLL